MRPVVVVGVACTAVLALAFSGCGTGGYTSHGSQGSGKKLFVQACGGCHTLADAGTNGKIGPNLDDAFAQARQAGMTSDTFTQVVATQIRYPITETSTGAPGMPPVDKTLPSCDDVEGDAFCVDDQDQAVDDVAVYVGAVAGTGVTAERPTDGKSIFTANCGSCHTLADAGTSGTVGLSVSFPSVRTGRDLSKLAVDVFALPQRLADVRRRKVVVALDEFQAIRGFDGGSVEQTVRGAVQHQRSVGYVFAGSEPSLMERMIGPKRPFYKAGPVMRLDKIPPEVFAAFIDSRFSRTGIRPQEGFGTAVVDLAGNLPYDVQRLAHETWDDARAAGKRRVEVEDLHRTLRRLLSEQEMLFEAVWQRLTLAQQATLRAVVLSEGRELLSADLRERYRLGGASTVQASLQALVREDLIAREQDRYAVVDSLMREWIARRTF